MQRHVLSDLFGLKKTVRGCGGEVHRSYYDKKVGWIRDLPCAEMREGETGGVGVAFEKFFLHKEVCLFCREAMPADDDTGCGQRVEIGLAYG